MADRTAGIIYRLYDAAGELLYIGESGRTDVHSRLREHAKRKTWWSEVDTWTTELARDRFAAERKAIRDEAPKYNVQRFRDKARLFKATCSGCSLIIYLSRTAAERSGMPTCACGSPISFAEDAAISTEVDVHDEQLTLLA